MPGSEGYRTLEACGVVIYSWLDQFSLHPGTVWSQQIPHRLLSISYTNEDCVLCWGHAEMTEDVKRARLVCRDQTARRTRPNTR